MRFDIEYGNGFLSLDLSRFNNVQTIESKAAAPIPNIQETVHQQIAKTNLFSDLSKLDPANSNLVLLIDTPSRIRYISSMLNPLLKSLRTSTIPSENIQLLVSEPFYRKYTVNRIQDILGPLDLDDVQLYMHNPTNGRQNKLVGNDPAKGFPIHLNKVYERASFRIVVTSVMRSTFFGSTGGYFGIAPGVCGIKTQNNLGRIQAVYESSAFQTHPTFLASAKSITEFAPPSLVFSIVQDAAGISADIFIDRIDTTWEKSSALAKDLSNSQLNSRSDIVILGSGGTGFDDTLYDACESLGAGIQATKTGGTIILVAECAVGVGPEGFLRTLTNYDSISEMKSGAEINYELGMERALFFRKVAEQRNIILCSRLRESLVQEKIGCAATNDPEKALELALKDRGLSSEIAVIKSAPFTNPIT